MRFIFIDNTRVEASLSSTKEYLKFICIDKPLSIDFVQVLPEDAAVQWTQIAGQTITILNSNTIAPTITFPIGYSSSNNIILRLEVVDYPDIFLLVEIDTKLVTESDIGGLQVRNSSFIPANSIPNILMPSYAGEEKEYVIYFDPETDTNFISSYEEVASPLNISRIEWYENIGGVYTLVSEEKKFNHRVDRHVKAKYYFKLNEFREEVVVSDVLNDEIFENKVIVAGLDVAPKVKLDTSLVSITRSNYLPFILSTLYDYTDEDTYIGNSTLVLNDEEIEISRNSYLIYAIDTDYLVGEDTKQKSSLVINSAIPVSISRLSYQFNGSGLSIG